MNDEFFSSYETWVKSVVSNKSNKESIEALNIGIFEQDNGFVLYLIGSSEYDKDDFNWACNQDYVPINKYFPIKDRYINGLDWKAFYELVLKISSEILEKNSSLIMKSVNVVTTGFDDGDLEVVWKRCK